MTREREQGDPTAAYFGLSPVAAAYAEAVTRVGLWRSEELLFRRLFRAEDTLLDVGTGAGRIAFGLQDLGYRHVIGVDASRAMIQEARRIARLLEVSVPFRVMDATRLDFGEAVFDGAIFGFNGLMQIPGRDRRRLALAEIRKAVKPGAWFAFTTHDRDLAWRGAHWEEERLRWERGERRPGEREWGDQVVAMPEGPMFMHVPDRAEILEDLAATGWRHEVDVLRSQLANEPPAVREFSDECRFWVAQRPPAGAPPCVS